MLQDLRARLSADLFKAIDGADCISFDIFETLLWRVYERPVDLFHHIELALEIPAFAELRAAAEQTAREQARDEGRHEVTLADIYYELPPGMARAMSCEVEQEIACNRRDPIMHAAYLRALEHGKRVVFASDMYLPLEVIETLLRNAGYARRDRLFLSSLDHRPKATGAMFEDVVAFAGMAPERILHIGDNYHSDVLMARAHGLQAFHYVSALELGGAVPETALFERLGQPPYAGHPATSLVKGLIAHEGLADQATDYWERFGFLYGGPIAHSFATWIARQAAELTLDRVLFMARDGHLVQTVFERLYPDIAARYMFASRRCFLLAGLREVDAEFLEHVVPQGLLIGHMEPWSYRDFYEQLGIEAPDLERAFGAAFPDLDRPVVLPEQLDAIRAFFRLHAPDLLAAGKHERDVLMAYFADVGLLEGRAGLVDFGWKGSLVRSIRRVCQLGGEAIHPIGLYFATHRTGNLPPHILSCALENGLPADSVLNEHQAVLLLEMMFSAPHPSIVRVARTEDGFAPVYQIAGADEAARLERLAAMRRGMLRFVDEYAAATRALPLPIPGAIAVGPLHALCGTMSREDRRQLSQVSYATGIGNVQRREQLCQPVEGKRFGLLTPWPGTRCAEYELMIRIMRAARNIGATAVPLSDQGYVLSRSIELTGEVADPYSLQFAISLHYYVPRLSDVFHYLTLWNPPEIPTHDGQYPRLAEHYLMYDDYLTAHAPRIESHLRTLLMNSPRTLEGMSELLTSFPADALKTPDLSNPTLFYCGMNWEKKVFATGARHEGLLKLLDKTGRIKFFGPDKIADWGDIAPWDGFDCYQYPIPFDGFSIVEEINACGVVLVMSSDDHRRSGMVTTRLYEACAGGAVIIADDNPFVMEHFHDAALFVEFNPANPVDTFRQIMAKLDWIKDNPAAALRLAERAQEIFRAKFSLERQLQAIFDRHAQREKLSHQALRARTEGRVLVSYVVDQPVFGVEEKVKLGRIVDNAVRQAGARVTLVVGCDLRIEARVRLFVSARAGELDAHVVASEIYSRKGVRQFTESVIHHRMRQGRPYDYLMFAGTREDWFTDHVTTLQRVLEDDAAAVAAHSGRTTENPNGSHMLRNFGPLRLENLWNCVDLTPGEVLFRRDVEDFVQPFVYEFVDGLEPYLYLLLAELRFDRKTVFSKRPTLAYADHLPEAAPPMFRRSSQVAMLRDMVHYEYDARRARAVVPISIPTATAVAEQDSQLATALAARTVELIQVREDLVARNDELVATRHALAERVEQAEALLHDLAGRDAELVELRAELVRRTGILDQLQELVVARTEQSETLFRNLTERNEEVRRLREGLQTVPG